MLVGIRVDSSHLIGTGHVMRCLTLAQELKKRGATVWFLCRDLPGNFIGHIRERGGFPVAVLPRLSGLPAETDVSESAHASWLGTDWLSDFDAVSAAVRQGNEERVPEVIPEKGGLDWMVVDHYALDHRWESRARSLAGKILVVDDIADRMHDCDALIDQNYYLDAASRYEGLVPQACRCMLGPEFALMRMEFHQARARSRIRDGKVRRIHVFYGGSDFTDETSKAIQALAVLDRPGLEYDIVVGGLNPLKERIREACKGLPNATFHCDVRNMAELMESADLCLGAGGTANWERSMLGLPAIITIVARNQAETTMAAAESGALCCLGFSQDATQGKLLEAIDRLLENPDKVKALSARAYALMEKVREPGAVTAMAFGMD
jgi:UDP-2,4-diacetamido-2,4,6-trideoxy-beta-L-altropyranose hydrolase